MTDPELLLDGLVFPEGPRWRAGHLWFSDMHAHEVVVVDASGQRSTIARVPEQPSGLGFLPDGRLLIVSMRDRRLLVSNLDSSSWGEAPLAPGAGLDVYADLTPWAPFHCNDLLVDGHGRAYVGNFGFDPYSKARPQSTVLAMVDERGRPRAVADELAFPNGMALSPCGTTLIVAETYARRLTAFEIRKDGSLTGRRVWSELPGPPDGIALDASGRVWVAIASKPRGCFLRVGEGGPIEDRIDLADRRAFACTLGGDDGHTLFLLEAFVSSRDGIRGRGNGRIRTVRVESPRAGLP